MNLQMVVKQVEKLPLSGQEEVLNFVELLTQKYQHKEFAEAKELLLLSQQSLQDWDNSLEDEAWSNYQ